MGSSQTRCLLTSKNCLCKQDERVNAKFSALETEPLCVPASETAQAVASSPAHRHEPWQDPAEAGCRAAETWL